MQRGAQLSLAGDNAEIVSRPEGHVVRLKHHEFCSGNLASHQEESCDSRCLGSAGSLVSCMLCHEFPESICVAEAKGGLWISLT